MNLRFGNHVFIRTAAGSYSNFDYNNLTHLLKDTLFQATIFLASPVLFNELKKHSFLYENLSDRQKLSLKKYYNRLCFRATPFGLFSAASIAEWSFSKTPLRLTGRQVSVVPDFRLLSALSVHLQIVMGENARFIANNTIYRVHKNAFYLRFDRLNTLKYELLSFQPDSFVTKLLQFCETERTIKEIRSLIGHDVANELLEQLISSGILLAQDLPNYLGDSYVLKVPYLIAKHPKTGIVPKSWKMFISLFPVRAFPFENLYRLKWPFPVAATAQDKYYVNTFATLQGGVNTDFKEKLLDALVCLDCLSAPAPVHGLETFKDNFKKRFDNQEVPLLKALDPISGINYSNLGYKIKSSEFDDVKFSVLKKKDKIQWTNVNSLLIDKISTGAPLEPVFLSTEDLLPLQKENQGKISPSISVLFREYGSFIQVIHAGGCSAGALLARFTLFNDQIYEAARAICKAEQTTNNQVLFAELSCNMEDSVANVTTRKRLYDYEICLLTPASSSAPFQIQPNDLYISVVNDEIILHSLKLNKRIIPRFSSAYNFNHHELGLFRFLCDLQYQGIKSDLSLNLQKLIPGLRFYPRIIFKSCILHPATWIISESTIQQCLSSKDPLTSLHKIFTDISLTRFFLLTDSDNHLYFDRDSEDDLAMFIRSVAKNKPITLKEALLSETSGIHDLNNNSYTTEMVAAVLNQEAVYLPAKAVDSQRKQSTKRTFPPADEWIYYKIYCVPGSSDEIIEQELAKIIRYLNKQQVAFTWFFLRYKDPDYHLRVRFKPDKIITGDFIAMFNNVFSDKLASGQVFKLTIDTYEREIERYPPFLIANIEQIFSESSSLVIRLLKLKKQDEQSEFKLMVMSLDNIIGMYSQHLPDKLNFCKTLADQFGKEHHFHKELSRQLDEKYRKVKRSLHGYLSILQQKHFIKLTENKRFMGALRVLNERLAETNTELKQQLYADIIHLHINRMLADDPRKQEFIYYYLLKKHYQSSTFIN
ncbi:MAG: hypothetical protein JWR38_2279 [Mucilaginibacter sp.]|nr:hypothetical protein [Mucilaginibacter sp.]